MIITPRNDNMPSIHNSLENLLDLFLSSVNNTNVSFTYLYKTGGLHFANFKTFSVLSSIMMPIIFKNSFVSSLYKLKRLIVHYLHVLVSKSSNRNLFLVLGKETVNVTTSYNSSI